ncbi:MAG TPA: PAS domain S-box protein [Ignavibacteriales bacterium]|nr:PAS domain S-box protein [Ignavibacteriales bacterium]
MQKKAEIRNFLEKLENSRLYYIFLVIFTALVFALDLMLLKGRIVWVLYILPMTGLSWKLKKDLHAYMLSVFYIALILANLFIKPSGIFPFDVLLTNRLLGILVLISVTYYLVKRKEAAGLLKERENQLSNAIRYNPLPAMVRAEDGEVISINDAWTELSGYTLEDIPTVADWAARAYRDRQHKMTASIVEVFKKKGKTTFGEFTIYHKNGEKRIWNFSSAQFGHLPDGRRAVITTAVDVTQRKRFEEALKESEERFRKTFEFASAGVAHTLPDGTWLRMNDRYCELLGFSREELKNLSYIDVTHPDDLVKELENKRKLLSGEIRYFSMEKRYVRKDGKVQWVLLNCSLASEYSNNLVYFVSVAEDLSHHKKVEEELETRRVRAEQLSAVSKALSEVELDFQAVIETGVKFASDYSGYAAALGLTSEDGDFTIYRSAYSPESETLKVLKEMSAEILHYSKEGIIGQAIRRSSSVLVTNLSQKIDSAVHGNQELKNYLKRLEADSMLAVPVKLDDRVLGVLVLIGKKGNRKISSEDISFLEEISGRIAQRIDNARLYREKLQEIEIRRHTEEMLKRSNQDLEHFAYIASHDLQEPIRMIRSYAQLLEKKYKDKFDKKAEDYLGYISEGGMRMQQLVMDLLQYSRITTKAETFEKVDTKNVLEDVVTDLKIKISEEDAVIKTGYLPVVTGDKTQIRRLFQNLIQNAIKFRNSSRPEITIGAEAKGRYWQFHIIDNGIGIEKEFFERIFVIFQRLHEREKYPGTGIGLAICKKIVERHSGEIWVESEPGRGSSFFFTLPS